MERPLVTMSRLGELGRFANQLIQYMFLRAYAKQFDLRVQTPAWIGQQIFGFQDPPIESRLPEFSDPYECDPQRMVIPRLASPVVNVDFSGFFQYPSDYFAPHKGFLQELFVPVDEIKRPMDQAMDKLRQHGQTVIGIHVRRGDYGYGPFYLTPTAWYIELLKTLVPNLSNPVVFVATDAPATVLPELAEFRPITSNELGVKLPLAPFYPDFYLLSQVDVLIIPNSTFSFAAGMLNTRLQVGYRSVLSDPLESPPFRQFDPWNSNMFERAATVENHPGIKGIGRRRRHRILSRKYWFGEQQ